jgi:hypothetical protein
VFECSCQELTEDPYTMKNPSAVALGSMTSPAKAAAARENGKKGGRPPLDIAARIANMDARMLAAVQRRFGQECVLSRQYVNKLGQTVSVWWHPSDATRKAMRESGLDLD